MLQGGGRPARQVLPEQPCRAALRPRRQRRPHPLPCRAARPM